MVTHNSLTCAIKNKGIPKHVLYCNLNLIIFTKFMQKIQSSFFNVAKRINYILIEIYIFINHDFLHLTWSCVKSVLIHGTSQTCFIFFDIKQFFLVSEDAIGVIIKF